MPKKITAIDIEKKLADYRITGISGKKYELRDKQSKFKLVNELELKMLKKKFKVVPDF